MNLIVHPHFTRSVYDPCYRSESIAINRAYSAPDSVTATEKYPMKKPNNALHTRESNPELRRIIINFVGFTNFRATIDQVVIIMVMVWVLNWSSKYLNFRWNWLWVRFVGFSIVLINATRCRHVLQTRCCIDACSTLRSVASSTSYVQNLFYTYFWCKSVM